MKKFVAFVLVMAMAAIVSAAPMTIVPTAGGEEIAWGSTIASPAVLGLKETATNGIYDLVITYDDGLDVDLSGITFPTAYDFPGKTDSVVNGSFGVTASQFFNGPVGGQLVDNMVFTGEGTITVSTKAGALLGTVVVPEPMTMSLLGLGGLAAIRRRRA